MGQSAVENAVEKAVVSRRKCSGKTKKDKGKTCKAVRARKVRSCARHEQGILSMKKTVLMIITSLWIGSSVYSQVLSNNQKEKIVSEITVLFEKNIKAAENLDSKELSGTVDDTLKAGFIDNGQFLSSFDEVMDGFKEGIKGLQSQKFSISNKKITVLANNAALLTASGNFSVALEDGRTLTGKFAWTFVYSKVNDNWKIIHSHMSTPR